ncbi:hypothetical protein PV08_09224 [Exophiala spinifera]|uniref:Major facilitator superfamily (MFS) profile domain-containing protein n=1 Tax=Exophiala spinifera TaxID=91928 RepID=A0A0D1YAI9_9EURO|nr:uncharacterized protein PV08_09224 [Exophiala spinifera]KIW11951.1 hypothetical protein PV08_09224 [Exophiala spinifera]
MASHDSIPPSKDASTTLTAVQENQTISSHGLEAMPKPHAPEANNKVHEVRPIHGWKWVVSCLSIYTTALLYGLDTTIAADVQPNIVKSLGEIEKLTWVGVGFPLGSVAIILPLGYAYGLFELKTLYLSSIVLFEAGSALCGGAPTMDALIVGRVIAGAGGAGMYLGVLNYLGVFTTLRERNFYNSLVGLVWGLGSILGPLVGGGFAVSSATWRWSFYINLVLAAVMAPFLVFYLPTNSPKPKETFASKIRNVDWVGMVLIAAVYSTYTMALTFGGAQWAWDDYRFIVMIVFFGIALIGFVVSQYFTVLTTKEHRLFPGHFLLRRSLILLFIGTSACSCTLFIGAYYIPLFFQFARSDSAIMAAVRLLPFVCLAITFMLLNGAFLPKLGYYMPWYFVAGVFMTAGGACMYTIDSGTSPSRIYGYSVLLAIGCGAANQSGYSIAAAKVKPEEIAAAIGFINVAQIGSIVISLTIAGSVFQNLAFNNLQSALAGYGFTESELRSAVAGTQSAVFRHSSDAVRQLAVAAIIKAMNSVFILTIAAGAVTMVSSVFMKRERLFLQAVAGG